MTQPRREEPQSNKEGAPCMRSLVVTRAMAPTIVPPKFIAPVTTSLGEDEGDNEALLVPARWEHPVFEHDLAGPAFYQQWITKVRADGLELRNAPIQLRNDKRLVMESVRECGAALRYAAFPLKADKEIVLTAVADKGRALHFASRPLKFCKEIVLKAVMQDGHALQYASNRLRRDKEVVKAAAASHPDAIKFALGAARQAKGCLIAAGIWDENHCELSEARVIALSTRFSLKADSEYEATHFTALLKQHDFIRTGGFVVYSPNAFDKSTCDPTGEYTNIDWICRGTCDTCQKEGPLKTGRPRDVCCWRYSFRYQLERAKQSQGFMIQVVEAEDRNQPCQELGKGQQIEWEMAQSVGTKTFRVHRPRYRDRLDLDFCEDDIESLVSEIRNWYDGRCCAAGSQKCTVQFPR